MYKIYLKRKTDIGSEVFHKTTTPPHNNQQGGNKMKNENEEEILPEELAEVAETFGMSRNEYITIHGKTYLTYQEVF